jgi:hypothetical protein
MKPIRLLAISVFAVFVSSCASPGQGWVGAPLKDTSWKLVTIESKTNDSGRDYVANKADIVMNLRASGAADFKLDCEQGQTDWEASWERLETMGEIRFYPMQITASSSVCEPNIVLQRFLRDFDYMSSYVLVQNHLYINTQANEVTYGWRKIESQ